MRTQTDELLALDATVRTGIGVRDGQTIRVREPWRS